MFARGSNTPRPKKRMLLCLLSSLTLSMSLTGCGLLAPEPQTRLEFVSPKFQSDDLNCADAPRGQLPYTAPASVVAERFRATDEAGEDCRQKLNRARMKIEVTEEIVNQLNDQNKENPK